MKKKKTPFVAGFILLACTVYINVCVFVFIRINIFRYLYKYDAASTSGDGGERAPHTQIYNVVTVLWANTQKSLYVTGWERWFQNWAFIICVHKLKHCGF